MSEVTSNLPVTQPSYFIPHGAGPCFFMDWKPASTWQQMAAFLSSIESDLPAPPKAILLILAHWQNEVFALTVAAKPDSIYDYFGFPESTYQLTYPAPGAPELALAIAERINAAGFPSRLEQIEVLTMMFLFH